MKGGRRLLAVTLAAGIGVAERPPGAALHAAADPLEAGFKSPPNEARPRVCWHWTNGNVTKEGITLDLEWMKRVGVGGVQQFDASIGNILIGEVETAKVVEPRVVYRPPEWKDMLRHAAAECDRRAGSRSRLSAVGGRQHVHVPQLLDGDVEVLDPGYAGTSKAPNIFRSTVRADSVD